VAADLGEPMKTIVFIIIGVILGTTAHAAGIDSRSYSCAALHTLITSSGFLFISQPAFGDFVVAGPYYCSGGQVLRLRSVPTLDRPECTVNYCETRDQAEQQ
jgi:hypothetical protein